MPFTTWTYPEGYSKRSKMEKLLMKYTIATSLLARPKIIETIAI